MHFNRASEDAPPKAPSAIPLNYKRYHIEITAFGLSSKHEAPPH